jgi:lipoprotein-releasing system permease protein
LSFDSYIAKRLSKSEKDLNVSTPIIKIAIGAIALGLAIMIITVATGTGLQHEIRRKLSGVTGHIQIFSFDNSYNYTSNPVDINQEFFPEFRSVPEVSRMHVFATKPGVIRTDSDFEGIVLKGVSSDYDWSFFQNQLIQGELPIYKGKLSREVLISENISNSLSINIGDKFNVFFLDEKAGKTKARRFIVKGIFNTGLSDFDDNFVICDLSQIQRLNSWGESSVGGFEVFIDDFDKMERVLPEVYHQVGFDLNAVSLLETNRYVLDWIDLFDLNIMVILFIMLCVAGINMITALLILILEKTQMIGMLKALGADNWKIRKIFLRHAFYLISRGLLIGNSIAISILLVQKYLGVVKLDPKIYYVNQAPVNLDLIHIILINVITLVLVLLLLLLPSYIVTKISPSKAIKFE